MELEEAINKLNETQDSYLKDELDLAIERVLHYIKEESIPRAFVEEKIEDLDKEYTEILKDKILKFLSSQDVGAFSSGYAVHSKTIAEVLKVEYETIKKIMKEMKKEGLVVYENKSYTVCEDYEMQEFSKFRNIGWLLTDKARQTDIWKKENEKEKKIWEDINKDIEKI